MFGLLHPVSEFFLYILIISFVTKQKWVLNKSFGLLHPVSEFFLYILIVSFVTKQKWVYKKKKECMFHRFIAFHPVS